jgi:hypothetical protein
MKLRAGDFPLLTNGQAPHWPEKIYNHVDESELSNDYWGAWPKLLACKHVRIIRWPVVKYIVQKTKIRNQLAKLMPEAKIEACWYIQATLLIGVVRCAPDATLVVIVHKGVVICTGGIFTDLHDNDNPDEPRAHYDLAWTDTENDEPSQAVGYAALYGGIIPTFIEFAESETVVLNAAKPGKRKIKIDDERILTELPVDVEYIDSGWFRTCIRNGDFNVSGHFRLQPYGSHMAARKLIWIKDFVKHGYHRTAKIEKLKDNPNAS